MIVLITGANTGLGRETAKQLLLLDHTIYIACRSEGKANATIQDLKKQTGKHSIFKTDKNLDLSSLKSVLEFASDFVQQVPLLDLLINNAGIMAIPQYTETEDGVEVHFAVNHLGHFLLTKILLGSLLQQSRLTGRKSKVINLSSEASMYMKDQRVFDENLPPKLCGKYDHTLFYAISKLHNILFTAELNKRYFDRADGSIVSMAVHPGVVQTDIARNMFGGKAALFLLRLYKYISPDSPWAAISIEEGAQTTLHCALLNGEHELPAMEDQSDYCSYYTKGAQSRRVNRLARDAKNAAALWELSERLVSSVAPSKL